MQRVKILINSRSREEWLLSITVAGLLCGLLVSLPAWSAIRSFPLSPILPNFSLPSVYHTSLLLLTLAGLVGSLLSRHWRGMLIGLALSALCILVLLDITRLQPWLLHYTGILILFILPIRKVTGEQENTLLDAAAIIIAGIYVWSGIQKINLYFVASVFPWFTEPLWLPFGETGATAAVSMALLVPFIEIGIGVGLLSRRLRTLALYAASGMLVMVLICLGPFGHNWNSVVWPWNIALFLMALCLFCHTTFSGRQFVRRNSRNTLAWFALILFWIVPAGNLIGITDHYLSWSLYSGKTPSATLTGDQLFLQSLSPWAENETLSFQRWSLSTMNVVPYPEKRVLLDVFHTLCDTYPAQRVTLTVYTYKTTPEQHECRSVEHTLQ